ncbi:xylosyltransferase oxt [Cladorrhinum samala]|uniref:Xylosyltransferase oxt n=1 Tax=Cladorrhinum samala TaxID=585594 RepID=A0AAV9HXD8_9PEZI|nr:xylosyltransferase oxt [Cladorrhinum samala]
MINDFESNLPIPNHERNHGSGLEVCHCQQMGNQHPWRKAQSEYDDQTDCRHTPEDLDRPKRKLLGLELPIALLTFFLALSVASIIIVGGLLGHKISELEKQVSPFTSLPGTSGSASPAQTSAGTGLGLIAAAQTDTLQVTVPGWTYYGCFYDREDRVLQPGYAYDRDNMTNNFCVQKCAAADASWKYAGTEWRRCFCGESPALLKRAPDWACQTACPGQTKVWEACGGDKFRISVWKKDS